ncbi:MAG: hypothetical protein QNJ46_03505 [Leptolyngbyaceae cyanobacterium MO_188.B28]|nr:hypothetical protein [Leptolyngbyaceae cyanobacterium MO_188.B28]
MGSSIGFVSKVLIISAVLAALIKYIGPSLEIPATPSNSLIAILSPTLIMAILLIWRNWRT